MWRELEGSTDRLSPQEGTIEARARFLADDSFPSRAIDLLRSAGARVWTSAEHGLAGETHQAHASYAREHQLSLLSCKPELLDLQGFPPSCNPPIFVFHFDGGSLNDMRRALRCLAPVLGSDRFGAGCRVEANASGWTEYHPRGDGTRLRHKHRLWHGKVQEWIGESCGLAGAG